jgi:hypothetical protein
MIIMIVVLVLMVIVVGIAVGQGGRSPQHRQGNRRRGEICSYRTHGALSYLRVFGESDAVFGPIVCAPDRGLSYGRTRIHPRVCACAA